MYYDFSTNILHITWMDKPIAFLLTYFSLGLAIAGIVLVTLLIGAIAKPRKTPA